MSVGLGLGIGKGVGVLGGFNPALVSGMEFVFNSEAGVTGSPVATWVNAVPGNTFGNITQGVEANKPTSQAAFFASGKNSVRCDTTDTLDFAATRTLSVPYSLFWILQISTGASNRNFVFGDGSNLLRYGGSEQVVLIANGTTTTLTATGQPEGTPTYGALFVATGGAVTIWIDGSDVTSGSPVNNNALDILRPVNVGNSQHDYGVVMGASVDLSAQVADFNTWMAAWSGI
jgi:hypothetical protein